VLPQNLRPYVLTIAAALTGVLLLGGTAVAAEGRFADTEGRGFEQAVEALAAEELVLGCTPTEFCPDVIVTRAQAATLVARATGLLDQGEPGLDEDGLTTSSTDVVLTAEDVAIFDDVEVDDVHAAGIVALASADITRGCDEDAYCPDEPLSRAQLTMMLYRAFDVASSDERAFDDLGVTHQPAVNAFAAAGLVAGCSDRLPDFCPNDDIPRWQAAVLLARVLDLSPTVELAPLEERRAEQAEIDEAERLRIEAEEEAARQAEAEAEAARRAAAEAEAYPTNRLATWERLAQCESNGNWSINTGNGYYGGLQFALRTWRAVGGTGYPHQASKAEQIRRGEILQQRYGWGQWPACSRALGLR
jgi:hypothetical protein